MGKAKFGIFGDGKEVAQIAMAKVFRNGDHRSGYYRDQTFMLAIGEMNLHHYFAQLHFRYGNYSRYKIEIQHPHFQHYVIFDKTPMAHLCLFAG